MEHEILNNQDSGQLGIGAVMGSILSVANGWGEASTFYKVGSYYEKVEIAKLQRKQRL